MAHPAATSELILTLSIPLSSYYETSFGRVHAPEVVPEANIANGVHGDSFYPVLSQRCQACNTGEKTQGRRTFLSCGLDESTNILDSNCPRFRI